MISIPLIISRKTRRRNEATGTSLQAAAEHERDLPPRARPLRAGQEQRRARPAAQPGQQGREASPGRQQDAANGADQADGFRSRESLGLADATAPRPQPHEEVPVDPENGQRHREHAGPGRRAAPAPAHPELRREPGARAEAGRAAQERARGGAGYRGQRYR